MTQRTAATYAHTIAGVPGRMVPAHRWPHAPTLLMTQTWVSERRPVEGYRKGSQLGVTLRFDDACRNGRPSFAITGEIGVPGYRMEACGCLHEEIAAVFPELAGLIDWHLCASDGPTHYVANTTYLAGARDHWGLLKDESRQIRNGKTGKLAWRLAKVEGPDLEKSVDSDAKPEGRQTFEYVPWCQVGEGKARELDAARRAAIWPEATDAELCLEKAELEALLLARLPALVARFRASMDACGFAWDATEVQF